MHENGGNASPPSQSHVFPSDPNLKPFDPSKKTRIMENLKAAVLLRFANSHPNKALSAAQIDAIEHGLAQAFPSFRTPTHPTYASMVQTAILKLNEKGGSMESSISKYIMANYEGLPWAHKSYLSHYLNKLCENGEIVCTSTKCYTLPDLIHQPKFKKKHLRPKPGRKRKQDVTDEVNLGGQELMLMNEDEICFQEEETRVFVRNRAKRRSSLVVYEEDEEVGGKDVVGREGDMIRSDQRAVIEKQDKPSELNQGDEVGKNSELRQHGFGTNDECNDTVIMEEGLPETQQVVGCGGGIEQQAGLIELTVEKLMPNNGQDEVRTEVLPLDHDSSKGRSGLLLPPVPSTLEKRLPDECKNETGTKKLQLDSESCDANLVPVPIESVKHSALEDRNHSGGSTQLMLSSNGGNQAQTSVSDVDGNASENTLKQAVILERDQSYCAAHWMIVPFKGDTSTPARQKEMKPVSKERKEIIVCGLPSGVSMQPIRKPRVCRPKKRSTHCQKKSLLLLEKSVPASPVSLEGPKLLEYERMTKVSPQTGHKTKLDQASLDSSKLKKLPLQSGEALTSSPHETSVEEASLKLELEKQKLHLELSPASGPHELMSTDDEDLNIPLQQVKQKCGKQRKLSEGITTSKAPVLLSSIGAKLDAEPPASENTAAPQRNSKLARSKTKKQGQQLKSRLRSQGQKCENLEAHDTAARKSEVLPSFQFEEGCDSGKEKHDDQYPQLADSLADSAADKCSMEYLHDQQGDGQVQGSSHVELMPETVSLDAQCHELGENQQTMRDPGLSAEVEQATEVSLRESSSPWNQDGQKERTRQNQTEMVDVASPDPEPVTAASMEEKGSAENQEPQFMEKQIKKLAGQGRGIPEARPAPDHVPAKLSSSAELSPNLVIEAATVVCQLDQKKGEEPKNDDQIACLDFEATSTGGVVSDNSPGQQLISEPFSAKLGSQCQDDHIEEQQGKDESEAGLTDPQRPFATPVKRERRGRPQKQKEETKDASDSLNLRHQEQEAPAELASQHALSQRQNKGPKKDGRGRPRKRKQEIKDAPNSLNLQHQEQEALAESGSVHLLYQRQNKWPKKDGRGRPRKQKEETKDVAAPPNEDDQLQQASSEAAIQLIENDGHGNPRKQKEETTGNLAAPLNSHDQKKGGSSEIAIHQSSLLQNRDQKRDGRGRPRKQTIVINKDAAAPLNLRSQEQEGLFGLATHQHSQQQNKQLKRDGRGRPRKQNERVNDDMTALLSLHHQWQEELSEPETHQHSQLQSKQPEGDGSPQKRSGMTEEDAAVVVPLDQRLQEGSPESAVQQNKQPRRDGRGRPRKQDRGTKEDVGAPLNLDQQQKEGLSEPATHQMQNKKQKRDGRGRPLKKDAETKEDVAAALNLDHEQLEGPSGLASQQLNRQPKRDRRGRPRKLKGETKENKATLRHQQQELPMPAIHSTLDASVVAHELDQKEGGQPKETDHHVNFPDSEALATSEIPLSLDNQSNQMLREQKQHGQGESYKLEAAGTSLDSRTLQQCQEGVLKSTTAPALTEDESRQQEKENEPHQEENQLHSPDERTEKSQYQVHKMPSDQEQVTMLSASETPEQLMEHKEDRGGQLLRSKPAGEALIEQSGQQQEEEQCQLPQENQGQSRDQGKTPKQKSAKTKAVEVPLASKGVLRSRIKRHSQSEN